MDARTPAQKLTVQKYPYYLRFEHCCQKNIPGTKSQIKKVIETLKDFSNHDQLGLRHVHPLKDDGRFPGVAEMMKKYLHQLVSVDVGTRNGEDGEYRLLYFIDPAYPTVGQVVAVFINTH